MAGQTSETMDMEAAAQDRLDRVQRHQAAGRLSEAEAILDALIAELGERPRLLHYKGLNKVMQGDRAAGEALIRAGLEQAPEDPVQNVDLGTVLAQAGQMEEATGYFRTAVEAAPNFAVAQTNLGGALVLSGDHAEAISHLERAVELDGSQIDAHTNLGIAYLAVSQTGKAVDILYKALAIDPLSLRAHIQLSDALYRHERHDTAEHHARRALELAQEMGSGTGEAYMHLGNALASAGRMEAAAEALLQSAMQPQGGLQALGRLVHMRRTDAGAPELQILEQFLARADGMGPAARATLFFAAGKAMDDLGRHDEAFGHFAKANAITKSLHAFDSEAHVARAARLREMGAPAIMARTSDSGVRDIAPIFITGMPRSGTTLMDQMFSRHPKVTAGGELRALPGALEQNMPLRAALRDPDKIPELTGDDFTRLGEGYMDAVRAEGIRSEYVSDKMPSNYLYAGLAAQALPRAKFLFMRRHPLDCLLSNYMQHFGRNQPASSDFANLAVTYREFDRMVQHWSEVMPDRVRVVHYEKVVANAEAEMRDVLAFVGLDWTDAVLDHSKSTRQVNTASLAQVREPIYTRAVARWEKYAPHLTELAKELRAYLSDDDLRRCGVT